MNLLNKQNGITLIALVISIIIMLILAGVSINAIIGDDGIISRTQYATFLNEMTAVEEAVQMWKAGEIIGDMGEETKAIPVNGLCKVNDLTKTERLVGEVGYYRIWSMTEKEPVTSIYSSSSEFNSEFESEMIYFPAGVQDLYYLNNEAIGIKSDKTYVIDAATGMIYSMTGIRLKGVSCYSKHMATNIMTGTLDAPLFAESEVSGSQGNGGVTSAGNTESEFLEDGSKNPNYNEFGFRIIAGSTDTIYKLYNNGELWGKGLKCVGLDYSKEELNLLDEYKWSKYVLPSQISNIRKTYIGERTIFIQDNYNHLYAYGDNKSNKLGLTENEQNNYFGREPIKLHINNNDIIEMKKIFSFGASTYILTSDNKLYVAGANQNGAKGVGTKGVDISNFTLVNFPNFPNGVEIKQIRENKHYETEITQTYVLDSLGNIYSVNINTDYKFAVRIAAEDMLSIDNSKIIDFIYRSDGLYYLLENGNVYYSYADGSNLKKVEELNNISEIYQVNISSTGAIMLKNTSGKILAYGLTETYIKDMFLEKEKCLNNENQIKKVVELDDVLPSEIVNNDTVKFSSSIYDGTGNPKVFIYIMNSGKVWMSGNYIGFGLGSEKFNSMSSTSSSKIELVIDTGNSGISTLNNVKIVGMENDIMEYCSPSIHFGVPLVDDKDNIYITYDKTLMYGNDIVQTNWKRIAPEVKVKDVSTGDSSNRIAIIDFDGNAYFAESDFREVGVESVSESVSVGNTFKKLKDISNVKSINFGNGSCFVLTNDGKLYSAGKGKFVSLFTGEAYTGFWYQDEKNIYTSEKTKMTLLRENMYLVGTNWRQMLFVGKDTKTNSDALFFIGYGNYGGFDEGTGNRQVNELLRLDTSTNTKYSMVINPRDIKKLLPGWENSVILMKNGNIIAGGNQNNATIGSSKMTLTSYTDLRFSSPVIDIVMGDNWGFLSFLTQNGDLYCTGKKQYIGLGNSTEKLASPTKVNSNVIQVTMSSKYIVVVKSNGEVWGTGENSSGILGRWIGTDRKMPNSRYRTAFEWVECPELEI